MDAFSLGGYIQHIWISVTAGSDLEVAIKKCFSQTAVAAYGISAWQTQSWLMGPIIKKQHRGTEKKFCVFIIY